MKARLLNARVALGAALLLTGPAFAQSKGQLRLPEFAALTAKASDSVSVTLDSNLLGLGCRFLNGADPEEAAAKKVCTGLTGIYVRHYTFDDDYAYPKADIDGVRRQLTAPGWSRIVEARSRKENTDVDVFVLIDRGRAQGLSIIASEPREFTIVNIVGNIDLEDLHELEGKFNIPELEIDTGKKPQKPAPKKP
jgi:hypothetical protein